MSDASDKLETVIAAAHKAAGLPAVQQEVDRWFVCMRGQRLLACVDRDDAERQRALLLKFVGVGQVEKTLPLVEKGGVHLHTLDRSNKRTMTDAAHLHLFLVEGTSLEGAVDGARFLMTEEDGEHAHVLDTEDARRTRLDGLHDHAVMLRDGTQLQTGATASAHDHDLLVDHSAFDGTHVHTLRLPDSEEELTSLTPGEFWRAVGSPAQTDNPPTPAASALLEGGGADGVLAKLHGRLAFRKAAPPSGKLPALKVPDPEFLVMRLKAGSTAGLLSRRERVSRVGQPQALVNEVDVKKRLDAPFVFAVVEQGDPVPFENLADLGELREGLDQFALEEFATEKDIFYLPLNLLVVFDPALELRRPSPGRRFASEVDFDRDVVEKLDDADVEKEVHGFVNDPPDPDELEGLSERGVVRLDRLLHGLFARLFAGNDATTGEGVTRENVVDAHMFVLREMDRRGIDMPENDALAAETRALTDLGKRDDGFATIHPGGARKHADDPATLAEVLSHFDKPMALRMPAVFLVGSVCNHGESENDIDVLVRGPFDETTLHTIKFRLGRALPPRLSKRVQFITDPEGGPFTKHVPLYDLLLVPHQKREVVEMALHKLEKSERPVRLLKRQASDTGTEKEERFVFGAVLIPDEVDAQGDIYSTEDVRNACHAFMEHFGHKVKVMHKGQPVDGVKVIENYVTKAPETHGGETFPVGTWMIGMRVEDDALWADVKAGKLNGFSMGGTAVRESLSE